MTTQATTKTAAPAAAPLPHPDEARDTLFRGIRAEVFFRKLASIRPQYYPTSEKQAMELLTLAGKLRLADEEAAVKTAADADDPLAAANAYLDGVLQQRGLLAVKTAEASEERVGIRRLAADLAQDPTFYNAVLSVKAAEAEEVARQLGRAG